MAKGIHTEETLEALIEKHLLENGYTSASPKDYDREKALLPIALVAFIQETQPKKWEQLKAFHGDKLESLFTSQLAKTMSERGSLELLRKGFEFWGQHLDLAYFRPGNRLNPDLWNLYEKNKLTVVRQLRYDPNNENELDLVLFLNGVPVVTTELKNALTSQTAANAQKQYKEDRDPKAPIFRWKERALVHFAVDTDTAWFTTQLSKGSTHFFPFNRGNGFGAGNPAVIGKHRTHYLWEQVWERHSLLDLLARFIHLQEETEVDPNTGKKTKKAKLIFPRYHQWHCVHKLIDSARTGAKLQNYLIQHSAGSGKSNSIAWLAHRLSNLHDENDVKVYNTVVVLTDRVVLDRQLQETIYQFDHKDGVVQKIDENSTQLAQALATGVPIIISTIHKFGFIQDKIDTIPDRRYAVIVDEAHSSQSGEMATAVKEALASSEVAKQLAEEGEGLSVTDQMALRSALFRKRQPNMSFFAFTATPKFKTLEMFGHRDEEGKPRPFHLYSMRQAIEEGFILDVLKGYITFKRFFKLAKQIADDPELDKRKASSKLTRFVNLHPTNIAQKTEIVIEHFRECVSHQLDGRAKAMLVTGSRLQAVKYKLAFERYLKEKGYGDIRCLVAFSQEVKDDELPGVSYTEVKMNSGIKESELPTRFASDQYQLLIVADKYQTGFDQPLLVAMYVDKRLSGIQAVQTLSRLNRCHKGKETTLVLDFVNDREDILRSFQDFYEDTTTEEDLNPQRLYDMKYELTEYQIWTPSEVDGLASVFFKLPRDKELSDHKKLNAWLDPAVDRFKALGEDDKEKLELQEQVRGKLAAFKNLYSFLSQIVPFHDLELEKLYTFGRLLLLKLPKKEGGDQWDPGEDVVLASLRLKKEMEGNLGLRQGEAGKLTGPSETGTGQGKSPKEKLSTIIDILNERFGMDLPAHINSTLEGAENSLLESPDVQEAAKHNDKTNFGIFFGPKLEGTLIDHHAELGDFLKAIFDDDEKFRVLRELMQNRIYGKLREESETDPPPGNVLPFKRVPLKDVKPFENCIPALDLKVAAGHFTSGEVEPHHLAKTDPGRFDWVSIPGREPRADLFVAQVVGESMNRRIPNGAWCLWKLNPSGSRERKIVLAQHRDISDPEHGGHYTVKVYSSEKVRDEDGSWRHLSVKLSPDSNDESFKPIVLSALSDSSLAIIAELQEVLS